jgi:adenosyl cobinamide kinase/adenosyl cobinamide phosphate guanylyltransferase
MADGYFTHIVLHSLKNYHQERATLLSKEVAAACGAVNLCFHGYFASGQIVI